MPPKLTRVQKLQKALKGCLESGDYTTPNAPDIFIIIKVLSTEIREFYDEPGNTLDDTELDKCKSCVAKCELKVTHEVDENCYTEVPVIFENVSFSVEFIKDDFVVSNVILSKI